MKAIVIITSLFAIILASLLTINVFAKVSSPKGVTLKIEGQHAQMIYNTLSGVKDDGAAGHTYRNGKNITCSKTTADMSTPKEKRVPANDPLRYNCIMHVDAMGNITGGTR